MATLDSVELAAEVVAGACLKQPSAKERPDRTYSGAVHSPVERVN